MLADMTEPVSADLDAMQPRAESRVPGEAGRLRLLTSLPPDMRPGRALAWLWARRGPLRVAVMI